MQDGPLIVKGGETENERGGFDFGHYCSCREELKLIPLGSTSVLHHTNACFRGFLRGEVLHLERVLCCTGAV